MKSLLSYICEEEGSSVDSKSIDFETFLDNVNKKIEEVHQEIEKFNGRAGNVPDNDLSNTLRAIKDYINGVTTKLDELDTLKNELNKQHSVDTL